MYTPAGYLYYYRLNMLDIHISFSTWFGLYNDKSVFLLSYIAAGIGVWGKKKQADHLKLINFNTKHVSLKYTKMVEIGPLVWLCRIIIIMEYPCIGLKIIYSISYGEKCLETHLKEIKERHLTNYSQVHQEFYSVKG